VGYRFAKFLKDPYRWGELWKLNAEEIKNPQRIYPGQVLALDKSGNQPRLKLETVSEPRREYVDPIRKGIPSIAAQDIEPFLSEPRVIDDNGVLAIAPRVVALAGQPRRRRRRRHRLCHQVTDTDRLLRIFRHGEARFEPGHRFKDRRRRSRQPRTKSLAAVPPGQTACSIRTPRKRWVTKPVSSAPHA
jgi:hypothetical protein